VEYEAVAEIEPSDYFAPRVRLIDAPDHPGLCANAVKRIGDYLKQLAQHQFKGLWKAKQAAEAEDTPPNVRAIAYRLYENGGVLHRDETLKLSPEDKAALKALGVAGHRYAWFLPDMMSPKLRPLLQAFGTAEGQRQHSRKGQLLLDDYGAVAMKTLSQIDRIMNGARYQKGAVYAKASEFEALGLSEKQRDKLMQALGLVKVEPITVTEEVAVAAPVAEAPAKKKRRRRKGKAAPEAISDNALAAEMTEAAPVDAPENADATAPETPLEAPVKTPVEAVVEATAEIVAPAAPVTETREVQLIGWRQKSHEPREPRQRQSRETATSEKPARKGRPKPQTPSSSRGGKRPDQPRGERPQHKEPAVNPFSPFADLRQRLAEKVGQD
jgi:ATP-dependent RNA helicase SUPV3L1/SUV3